MARNNGHGRREAPRSGRGRRVAIVAGTVGMLAVAFGAGFLLANRGGEPEASVSPASPAATAATPKPEPDGTATPVTTPGSTPAPVLDDGRHFVFARSGKASPAALRFDLAEFLTGPEAEDAAAEHGGEATNGYFIVNDNPRLRSLPVADAVRVRYIPIDACCELVDGSWNRYVEAVNGAAQTDLDPDAPWWITVRGGEVVRIEQQYLP